MVDRYLKIVVIYIDPTVFVVYKNGQNTKNAWCDITYFILYYSKRNRSGQYIIILIGNVNI